MIFGEAVEIAPEATQITEQERARRNFDGQEALDLTVRALYGDAHDSARRHRGERGVAFHTE